MTTELTHELKVTECKSGKVFVDLKLFFEEHRILFTESADEVNHAAIANEFNDPKESVFEGLSVYAADEKYILQVYQLVQTRFENDAKFEIRSYNKESWATGWKDHFKVILTEVFAVCMPWQQAPEGYDRIEVEPALAFGTGQHETTRLCLRVLEKHIQRFSPESLLDVGTGSGILAIAAKKLEVPHVVGTDIDHSSVLAAKKNAEKNDVSIEFQHNDNPENAGQFSVVVANILKPALLALCNSLVGVTTEHGLIVLSGITQDQVDEVVARYIDLGCKKVFTEYESDWAVVGLQKQ